MSEGSPATFGDVTGEYLTLREGAGILEGGRAALWVRGSDAVEFLQGLLSQDVAALAVGGVARSLLLAPQGKLRALLWLMRGDDEIGIVTERSRIDVVRDDLGRYRIRVAVDLEADPRSVVEVWGPESAAVLEAAGLTAPAGWWSDGRRAVVRAPLGGLPRFWVLGAGSEQLVAAGGRRVGSMAATAVRVEAGEPEMDRDVDESTIPQEAGLLDASVSLDKGCYLGQELVARIDSRGRVNRLLRAVRIETNVLPPDGAEIVVPPGDDPDRDYGGASGPAAAGSRIGRLSSVAESLIVRAPVGLALLRREAEPGSPVEIRWEGGSAPGTVVRLPLSDFSER